MSTQHPGLVPLAPATGRAGSCTSLKASRPRAIRGHVFVLFSVRAINAFDTARLGRVASCRVKLGGALKLPLVMPKHRRDRTFELANSQLLTTGLESTDGQYPVDQINTKVSVVTGVDGAADKDGWWPSHRFWLLFHRPGLPNQRCYIFVA